MNEFLVQFLVPLTQIIWIVLGIGGGIMLLVCSILFRDDEQLSKWLARFGLGLFVEGVILLFAPVQTGIVLTGLCVLALILWGIRQARA